jgi:hypothetical protein
MVMWDFRYREPNYYYIFFTKSQIITGFLNRTFDPRKTQELNYLKMYKTDILLKSSMKPQGFYKAFPVIHKPHLLKSHTDWESSSGPPTQKATQQRLHVPGAARQAIS